MTAQPPVIRTSGTEFLGPDGEPLLLRGVCLGGWLLNITIAQPLAHEYANRFRGLDDTEPDTLADSFALESCVVREPLLGELQRRLAPVGATR